MKLLENKKFIAAVLILNCIMICTLVGYLVYAKVQEHPAEQSNAVSEQETVSVFYRN